MKLTIGSLPVGSRTADNRLLDQLQELAEKFDAESDSLLSAVEASNGEEDSAEERPKQKREPFGVVYARDADADRTVGYLKYVPMAGGKLYRIEGLYVEKEYRRKCIGYSLMKAFYGIFKEGGGAKINLGCIAANEEGMAFYANEGYRVSDAAYILDGSGGRQKKSLSVEERDFTEEEFSRIWNEMAACLDIDVNLPEEVGMMRSWYDDSPSFKPFSICSLGGIECAVFRHSRDSELYVPVISADPSELDQEALDGIALALLQYAKKKGIQQVCVADIHLPADLDRMSACWKKVGCTLFKTAQDLKPKKTNLKI